MKMQGWVSHFLLKTWRLSMAFKDFIDEVSLYKNEEILCIWPEDEEFIASVGQLTF